MAVFYYKKLEMSDMEIVNQTIDWLQGSMLMHCLVALIFIDLILGSARALIERSFNSSIGKKGLILKVAMILCSICTVFIDYAVDIDFFYIIPKSIIGALGVAGEPGLCETVIILFGIYEAISIVKNWSKLGLPGAKKLEAILEKYTGEI